MKVGLQQKKRSQLPYVILARHVYDDRGSDYDQAPNVPIVLFGYATEPFLAARAGWRPCYQIQPSRRLAARPEDRCIRYGCCIGRRCYRSDKWNRR